MSNNRSLILLLLIVLAACKDPESPGPTALEIEIPAGFPTLDNPANNPTTVEGVALGRQLFYDPILSANETVSCASCHLQRQGFGDPDQFSSGVNGALGNRNAPALTNTGFSTSMFWDGREQTLEDQARRPVPNPIEMHLPWPQAVDRLNSSETYREMFEAAFPNHAISEDLVVMAIAQFERTFISADSKFDRVQAGVEQFTESEARGFNIFFSETGDCFHCHGTVLFTDNLFHNNGLDEEFSDLGRAMATMNPADEGKFKTPTLRNVEFSAPYMHDGRFNTLEEVVDFYSAGLKTSTTIDPLMKNFENGGVQLSAEEKADLIAFIKTLSDEAFLNNPDLSSPF